MPTRRCCCGGPCYKFFDYFDRPDSEDIGDDYEVCSGSFEIVDSNLVGEGTFVVKHSEGTPPYGWMQIELYPVAGVTYRIEAYRGTEVDPCSGAPTVYAEFKCISTTEFELRLSDGDGYRSCESGEDLSDTPIPFTYCLSDDLKSMFVPLGYALCTAVDSESGDPNNVCIGGPNIGKYFQITISGGEGKISTIRYSEHKEYANKPDCEYCVLTRCCFPDYTDVIVGFQITVHNIGDLCPDPGDPEYDPECEDCDCTETMVFDVWVLPEESKCQCELTFYANPEAEPPNQLTPGPHQCDQAETIAQVKMTCADGEICLSIDLLLQYFGQGEYNYEPRCWPIGTAPQDIKVLESDPMVLGEFGLGDEQSCIMENSYITIKPYVSSNGCCTEDISGQLIESVIMEAKQESPPLEPCPFLEENICNLASTLSEKPIEVGPETCKACSLCDRPRRLNEITLLMIPDDKLREKAAKTIINDTGVGTDLAKIFGMFADANMQCGCNGLKDMLNTWTTQQINANKGMVIRRIYSEAQKRKIPVPISVIKGLVNTVILKNRLLG